MNKNHLTSAIASTAAAFAFFALPYSARAEPPRTSSRTSQTTEICVDVTQLEDVCNDQYPVIQHRNVLAAKRARASREVNVQIITLPILPSSASACIVMMLPVWVN